MQYVHLAIFQQISQLFNMFINFGIDKHLIEQCKKRKKRFYIYIQLKFNSIKQAKFVYSTFLQGYLLLLFKCDHPKCLRGES